MENIEKKYVVVQVSLDFHQKLKIRAAEERKTIRILVEEILSNFFKSGE